MSYLIAGLALGLLITFHEFGHYWMAKRTGMRVERFSLGFGPVIKSWRRGETEFALSAVPLGGYVKVSGMAVEDEVDARDFANYANKPTWQRILVIVGGPLANYLLAFVLGVGLLMTVHRTHYDQWTRIGTISPGLPAAAAGVKEGDEILSVDGVAVHDFLGLREAISTSARNHPGQSFPIIAQRNGAPVTFQVQPKASGGDSYIIGVSPADRESKPLAFQTAVVDAGINLWTATVMNAQMIGQLLHRHSAAGLSGPIGIITVTASEARKGLPDLVMIVWTLSIAVGFLNMMPFPGLDGGRFLFLMYELVARRRMDQRIEGWIHGVGLILLLALIVFISYGDIMHLVHGG